MNDSRGNRLRGLDISTNHSRNGILACDSQTHAPWTLAIILIVAAAFRLPLLDSTPPGLNQDEASRGYDAWCILETRADRYGERWPLFTRSFGEGDYPPAFSVYLTSISIAMLGPTVQAIRLPAAALGVLTVWGVYAWLRRQMGARGALLAAAVLAVDPWHIALSRTAIEGAFAPFLLAMALLGLSRSGLLSKIEPVQHEDFAPDVVETSNASWPHLAFAAIAGVMISFHAWVYSATRLFTPLLCIAIVLIFARRFARLLRIGPGRKLLLSFAVGLLAGGWPLWWTALQHPARLAARANATLIEFAGQAPSAVAMQFLSNFLTYMDPRIWFLYSRDIVGTELPGIGQHLWIAAPLIITGLGAALVTIRKSQWSRLLICWFILAPLPAAICKDDHPHPTRAVGGMLLWATFAGIGGCMLWTILNRLTSAMRRFVIAAAALAVVGNTLLLAKRYFFDYPPLASSNFQAPLVSAIKFAAARSRDADFIFVTGRANEPYIYAMLFEPIPPSRLSTERIVMAPAPANFQQILRVGKWFFAPTAGEEFPEARRRFEEEWGTLKPSEVGLIVITSGVISTGELIARIDSGSPSGADDAFEIRRVSIRDLMSAAGA